MGNVTRFLIMSKNKSSIETNERDLLTTLVFVVRSIPASLYKCLGGFASNGINITKLESYINPQGFDVAQFYADIEGHPESNNVKLALSFLISTDFYLFFAYFVARIWGRPYVHSG